LLLILALLSNADGGDHEVQDWGNQGRDMQREISGSELTIRGVSSSAGFNNTFELIAQLKDEEMFAKYELKLKMKNVSSTGEHNTIELGFMWKLYSLFEYNENGTNAGYQESEDLVVSTYTNANWVNGWSLIDNSTNLLVFGSTTEDGVLSMNVTVTGSSSASLGFVSISSSQVKIDIGITNYPYQGAGTYLALQARLRMEGDEGNFHDHANNSFSEGEIQGGDHEHHQKSVNFAQYSNGLAAQLNWVPTVTADGNIVNVISSQGSDSEERYMYFAFNTSDQISQLYWDPTIGYTSTVPSSSGAIATLAIAVFMILGLVF